VTLVPAPATALIVVRAVISWSVRQLPEALNRAEAITPDERQPAGR
jgi:hypothetical protein